MSDEHLRSVEKNYAAIDRAAGEFLQQLTGSEFKKDIMLAAEMCGLKLTRAANVDLSTITPGTPVLGLVPDETYNSLEDFIMGWAHSNGLNSDTASADIPRDLMAYLPEVTKYEAVFDTLCKQNGIDIQHFPFAAATAALKLVAAAVESKTLDAATGLSMIIYHIIAGSKTAPDRPASSQL